MSCVTICYMYICYVLHYVIFRDGKCPFPGFNKYISAFLYSYIAG